MSDMGFDIPQQYREWYLVEAICLYYEHNPTGGSLHIALDDGNASASDIAWCQKYAEEHHDRAGYHLAGLILDWFDVFEPLMQEHPYRWHNRAWEKVTAFGKKQLQQEQ